MAYLVYHTLNRNGTYTGGKPNPLPIHGKSPTDKSQYTESQKSVILNIQYTGQLTVVKLKALISVGYVQYFEQKSYIMTFS